MLNDLILTSHLQRFLEHVQDLRSAMVRIDETQRIQTSTFRVEARRSTIRFR
jgi:hypothetical protein